jgi:hypothetical protein
MTMRKLSLALAALVVLVTGNTTFAHHSFAAEYDDKKPVTLRGTLTRMEWVNPHGWIYLDVKDATGKVVNWAVETGGPNALIRRGLKKSDFPAGVEIMIDGYLAKDGSSTVNANTVKFPDGRNFFAGSSGTGAPADASPRP